MLSLYCIAGCAVLAGVLWGVWAARYFFTAYSISGVGQILPSDMAYIIFAAALPVILLMMIAAIAFFAIANQANRAALVALLRAARGQNESLISTLNTLNSLKKLGFSSQFFAELPTILDGMAYAVGDIIAKSGMASEPELAEAMGREQGGRLGAVCRIILDLKESTPNFDENLRRRVKRDERVARAIAVFLEKYARLGRALAEHDAGGLVRESIEGGDLGQARTVLAGALAGTGPSESVAEDALGIRPVSE